MQTAVARVAAGGRVGFSRLAGAVAATGALAAGAGATLWLVLAASERPSLLSPPTLRAPHRWLLGPLSGALPGLSTDHTRLHADLTTALVVLFVAWVVAWACAPSLPVRAVAAGVAVPPLLLFLGPPQPLTDFFNSLVYGRMAAHGLNPYRAIPAAGPHDTAYALANWHHLASPYGPLFTLLSEPLGLLPLPVAYWVLKALIVGCWLGVLALVWWLAGRLGRSPQRALAAVGLCPVALAVGVGGFHNDAPALLCVVAAAALLVRGEDAFAAALAVVAAGIKPSFAVVVPIVVLGARNRRAGLAAALGMAAAVAAVIGLDFGGKLPAISTQGKLVSPLSVPNLTGVLIGHGGADAAVRAAGRDLLVVAGLAACVVVARRRDLALPALGVVLLLAVASLSWVMPWYLVWSLPFAALAMPRALVPLAVATCLWLGVGGVPQLPKLMHDVGYYPTRNPTGRANHLFEKRLVR